MDDIEALIAKVIDVAYHLHVDVGPGLLESVYEAVLTKRLALVGLRVEKQMPVAIEIDGIAFGDAFRADLFVEDRLLIELKSMERLSPLHIKQTITYLRLMRLPIGLLINFGGDQFKDNVKRVTNNYARR